MTLTVLPRPVRGVVAAAALSAFLGAWSPADARAQDKEGARPAERAPRFDVAIGMAWRSATELGSRDARLAGAGIPAAGDFVLFRTSTRQAAAPGLVVRAGVRLTRRLLFEGGVSVASPGLDTTISGDAERAAGTTATARLREYVFDGGLRLEWRRARARAVPFVRGSIGHLRQLSDDRTVVETGLHTEAGVGVLVPLLRRGRAPREMGLRGEVAASLRQGGFDLDEGRPWRSGLGLAVAGYVGF